MAMSMMGCVPVTLWMVVMHPCAIPRFSWITCREGERGKQATSCQAENSDRGREVQEKRSARDRGGAKRQPRREKNIYRPFSPSKNSTQKTHIQSYHVGLGGAARCVYKQYTPFLVLHNSAAVVSTVIPAGRAFLIFLLLMSTKANATCRFVSLVLRGLRSQAFCRCSCGFA